MSELTASSVLSIMDTTKEQRKSFVSEIISKIESGEISPLKVHCQVKAMENLIKQFTDKKEGGEQAETYSKLLLEEAEKYGKTFEFNNGKFSIKEVGVKYDYSNTGDVLLHVLQQQLDELNEKVKQRQEFLKTVPGEGMVITDKETGESYEVFPPSKSSTTSVTVSIK